MTPRILHLVIALLPLTAAAQEADTPPAAAEEAPTADTARDLLSKAWQGGDRETFLATAKGLLDSADKEVAALAAATLAEYRICVMQEADTDVLNTLRQMAETSPELRPTLAWLEAEQQRLRGELDAAAAACRQIETNHDIPTTVRQRARLILSDIYYAKEAEAKKAGDSYAAEQAPAPEKEDHEDADDDEQPRVETLQTLEGKGEETLLSFITANPNSPLLEEAFRRLKAHRAFETSEYARAALNEWVKDTAEHKRRAALALSVLQHLLNRDDVPDSPVDTSCASVAATALPQEPATAGILLDQMRSLYLRGREEEARALLASLPESFPTPETAAAAKVWKLLLNEPQGDWDTMLAEKHSDALQDVIRHNAFLSALAEGKEIEQDDPRLNLLTAQCILSTPNADATSLERAQHALQRAMNAPQADAATALHARILMGDITARRDPQKAIAELTELREGAKALPAQLVTPYYRVLERAYRAAKPDAEALECIIAELQGVYSLRMHLASLMVLSRNHREDAIRLLKKIVAENPHGDNEPQALLLLAECTAQANTLNALKEAADIYARAAAHANKATGQQARIRRAALLVRLGKPEDAVREMRPLLADEEPAAREEAMARMVLSNALALPGGGAEKEESMRCLEEMMDGTLAQLPRRWQFMLLQTHATRCMRLNENARAMRSLNAILEMQPAQNATSPQDPEWEHLYHAASSAVQALLELGQYAQAADIAERTANCNPSLAPDERPKTFLEWAAQIRQEHISTVPSATIP